MTKQTQFFSKKKEKKHSRNFNIVYKIYVNNINYADSIGF
jgi:hypothetical protein